MSVAIGHRTSLYIAGLCARKPASRHCRGGASPYACIAYDRAGSRSKKACIIGVAPVNVKIIDKEISPVKFPRERISNDVKLKTGIMHNTQPSFIGIVGDACSNSARRIPGGEDNVIHHFVAAGFVVSHVV